MSDVARSRREAVEGHAAHGDADTLPFTPYGLVIAIHDIKNAGDKRYN